MKRTLAILALLALAMNAAPVGTYVFARKATLVAAAEAVTVQLAAGAARTIVFTRSTVYCSAQCEITLERSGTAATTTGVMVPEVNSATWSAAEAFYSSNVGAGTVVGRYVIPAGLTLPIPLDRKTLRAGGNFSIRTDAITGTVIVNLQWEEF